MEKSYSTQGIRNIIVANAHIIAQRIITTYRLPSHHFEDLLQQLLIAGIRFEKEYRAGARSINTYLTKRMLEFGRNIERDAQAHKRKVHLFTCEFELESIEHACPQLTTSPDFIAIVEIRNLESQLDTEEKLFLNAMLDANLIEARKTLGWSRYKFERVHQQIKEKLDR